MKKTLVFAGFVFSAALFAVCAASAGEEQRGIIKHSRPSAGGYEKRQPLYSGYYALVIGCGEYGNGWPYLPNPVKDARQVAGALRKMRWEVDTLENPTGFELKTALHQAAATHGKDADKAILIWFSGHGGTSTSAIFGRKKQSTVHISRFSSGFA